jgi:hypothetical protein
VIGTLILLLHLSPSTGFFSEWCQEALSITITDFGSGYLPTRRSSPQINYRLLIISILALIRYDLARMLEGCACHLFSRLNFVAWTREDPFRRPPSTPISTLPFHRIQTHPQRQVSRTCIATSYIDSDLEGWHPVVARYDGSLFSSSLLITESDRLICPISFYETYDRGSLLSRIDTGKAIRLVYHRGLFVWIM